MDLVVDANVLFAALIRDNITSELMLHDDIHLFAPEFLITEFEGYRELIREKTDRSDDEFDIALDVFQRRIELVPIEEIKPHVKKAKAISPDIKDVPYIALALKLNIDIWSNDKALKNKQNKVRVHSTQDLVKLLK